MRCLTKGTNCEAAGSGFKNPDMFRAAAGGWRLQLQGVGKIIKPKTLKETGSHLYQPCHTSSASSSISASALARVWLSASWRSVSVSGGGAYGQGGAGVSAGDRIFRVCLCSEE